MPTIRITDETLKDLERIASEFRDLKRPGYESIFKITPDIVIKQLIEDWDTTEKEDLVIVETEITKRENEKKASKETDNTKSLEKIRKIQEKMYREDPKEDQK